MSYVEFAQTIGPIASGIAAVAAFTGAVFAFLNWRRASRQDAPRARLEKVSRQGTGATEAILTAENPGTGDALVVAIEVGCGVFAGEEVGTGIDCIGLGRTEEKRRDISLLIPSGCTRSVPVCFHADDPFAAFIVTLVRRGRSYVAVLSASRK